MYQMSVSLSSDVIRTLMMSHILYVSFHSILHNYFAEYYAAINYLDPQINDNFHINMCSTIQLLIVT